MKVVLSLLALAGLVAGGIYWLRDDPGRETPPPVKSELGGDPFGGTTKRPDPEIGRPGGGGVEVPLGPGFGAPGFPAAAAAQSAEVFAEFAEEIGLSQRETEEFLGALKKSNEDLFGLAGTDGATGAPKLPDPDKMMEHLEERERILVGELGEEGYGKFKAFSSTLGVRRTIDRLGDSAGGSVLTSEQKASVLYGAYDDLQNGNLPGTPDALSAALTSAVLKRSAEYLSGKDQRKLASALKEGGVLGLGAGGAIELPPGLPPIPNPGSGPPRVGPAAPAIP